MFQCFELDLDSSFFSVESKIVKKNTLVEFDGSVTCIRTMTDYNRLVTRSNAPNRVSNCSRGEENM